MGVLLLNQDKTKSGVALRDTWSKRQAWAMEPVRRAGWGWVWVWAASFAPAEKATRAECTCVGAAHTKHINLILCL